MHSPRRKFRRWLTRKEKGKKKMLKCGTDKDDSDQSDSNSEKNEDEPSEMKSESAKRAFRSTKLKLHQSTRQKNLVMQFRYNEYMVHHYVYMTRVTKVREPESYVEVSKDANWCATMEEEMHALVENKT